MMTAKGVKGRIEYDGYTIRIIETGMFGGDKHSYEIPAASVLNVDFKEAGLVVGYIHFDVARGKVGGGVRDEPSDLTITFREKGTTAEPFVRLRDAIGHPRDEARTLGWQLERILVPGLSVPNTTPTTVGTVTLRGLRLGELSRQFDTQTAGMVSGQIEHELGIHGGYVGIGRFGYGRLGISGSSEVELSAQSTTRSDLLSNAFMAVFDTVSDGGIPDTMRVVAPSEAGTKEMLAGCVQAIESAMGSQKSVSAGELQRMMDVVTSLVHTDVAYVSDRLSAVLRVMPTPAPEFSVVGLSLGSHAVLGGAIQMPDQEQWLQLFPIELLRILKGPSPLALPRS